MFAALADAWEGIGNVKPLRQRGHIPAAPALLARKRNFWSQPGQRQE
jgi:hypothetical protein